MQTYPWLNLWNLTPFRFAKSFLHKDKKSVLYIYSTFSAFNKKKLAKSFGKGSPRTTCTLHTRTVQTDRAKNIQSCFSVVSFPVLNRCQKSWYGLDYDLPECCCKLRDQYCLVSVCSVETIITVLSCMGCHLSQNSGRGRWYFGGQKRVWINTDRGPHGRFFFLGGCACT